MRSHIKTHALLNRAIYKETEKAHHSTILNIVNHVIEKFHPYVPVGNLNE